MLALVPGYNAGSVALYCVLGFVLVMAVLAILVVILTLFGKGFGAIEKATSGRKNKPKKDKSKKSAHSADGAAQTESSDADEEVVAAITAALMAYYDVSATDGEDDVPPPFIIKSIKKN